MDKKGIIPKGKFTQYIKKTYEIDKELFHEFNVIAAQKDKKHKEIINELLRNYVNKNSSISLK